MRRIIVKEARPGMKVARNLQGAARPDRPGAGVDSPDLASKPLFPAGATITADDIVLMHREGVYDLWVEFPELDFFDHVMMSAQSVPQQRLADALRLAFEEVIGLGVPLSLLRRYNPVLQEVMHQLVRVAESVPCFAGMTQNAHEDLLRHSCEVVALSTLLGLYLEDYLIEQRPRLQSRQARDVNSLALGCLFHDVGETVLPADQRESTRDLAFLSPQAAGDAWREHTGQGYHAVRKQLDPSAAAVVLHHHQHFDGSGFSAIPVAGETELRETRQMKTQIHIFARVATAADMFFHLLRPPGGVPLPAVNVLAKMQSPALAGWIDPAVLRGLLNIVPAFAAGMLVTLRDRRQAIVSHVHSESPCFPQVQLLSETDISDIIDLSATGPEIIEANGSDVQSLYGKRVQPLVAA